MSPIVATFCGASEKTGISIQLGLPEHRTFSKQGSIFVWNRKLLKRLKVHLPICFTWNSIRNVRVKGTFAGLDTMRFLVTILLCLGNLFVILEPSQAQQNVIAFSPIAGKETWLASTLSSIRRAVSLKRKWSAITTRSISGIRALHPEVRSEPQMGKEEIRLPKPLSSALKTVLSGKSQWSHNPSSYTTTKHVTLPNSVEKSARMFSAGQVPKPSPVLSMPRTELNSTVESDVVRQTGSSASPTPIPRVLFDEVVICKARNPIWNVAIRNKMGELLIVAYPGSLAKAELFARCIRDDVTTMKREEYLKFAVYNCVGTDACPTNSGTGVCSCSTTSPTRCINVDYTRALIECKYGPGV